MVKVLFFIVFVCIMNPRLVEHMFKPVPIPVIVPQVSLPTNKPVQIVLSTDHTPLFINIVSILIMMIGGYCLYHRKISKERNNQEHIQRIENLYKGINLK